jgi:hypothetical protein
MFSEDFRNSQAILKTFPADIEEYRCIARPTLSHPGLQETNFTQLRRRCTLENFMTGNVLARYVLSTALVFTTSAFSLWAQCPTSVVAAGLQAPTKIITVSTTRLLVAEAGFGPNMGRISVLNPVTSQAWSLIDGLPGGFSPPNNDPSGVSGLAFRGTTLFLTIGLGDAVVAGPIPNTQIPNPHPSSPLFSSVLALDLGYQSNLFKGGYSITPADQAALKTNHHVTLHNGSGDKIVVRLVADFPNYVPEPVAGAPDNVRQSNPFGIAAIDDDVYVPDASSNSLRSVDLETKTWRTLTNFAPLPNSRGFGPPVVEAVPSSIRRYGADVLVTLLSGFPFPIGGSKIFYVNTTTRKAYAFISGLTSAIDVTPIRRNGITSILTLEFSADMLAQPQPLPGRLKLFANRTATPSVIADCLITPTSMAKDVSNGSVYVTEIFTGRVMRVTLP